MFAEKPTDAHAPTPSANPAWSAKERHPRTNDRARHTPDAPATAHVHAGAPTVAAAATPLIAIVAARTATGTPPLAPTIPDAAAAAASKNPYVADAAATYPYGAGRRTYSPNPRNTTRPNTPPVNTTSAAPVAIARAVLDASRRAGRRRRPGTTTAIPVRRRRVKTRRGRRVTSRGRTGVRTWRRGSRRTTRGRSRRRTRKRTNTNAAACVAASRRDKTPRDAERPSRASNPNRSCPSPSRRVRTRGAT